MNFIFIKNIQMNLIGQYIHFVQIFFWKMILLFLSLKFKQILYFKKLGLTVIILFLNFFIKNEIFFLNLNNFFISFSDSL